MRMASGLDSFALLAIPFFILAGNIMNSGGIALRLIDFAKVAGRTVTRRTGGGQCRGEYVITGRSVALPPPLPLLSGVL